MENKDETLNSLNEEKEKLEEELNTLDSESDKEKISEITEKVNSLNDEIKTLSEDDQEDDRETLVERNKRLYARAKKAEGFILEDGKWIKKPKPAIEIKKPEEKKPETTDIDKLLDEKLEKRDLESLDLSDELKKEVQTYAKVQGISIKKALTSEYISFLKEKDEKKQKINNASISSSRKGFTKKDYSGAKAEDFDMRTPEGRAEFEKYKAYLKENL
jgi:hypothetical protein